MTHYILMGGMHGCLPEHCDVYDSIDGAVDSAASMYELSAREQNYLKRAQTLDMKLSTDGVEYLEIQVCSCDKPWIHQD